MNALAPVDEAKVALDKSSRLLHLEGPKTAWQLSISAEDAVTFAAAIYFTIATMAPASSLFWNAGMAGLWLALPAWCTLCSKHHPMASRG